MYGMPTGMGPTGFDPSMFLMAGYLVMVLVGLIFLALILGILTLPLFFLVLFATERAARGVANSTGSFAAKLVLYMFRGLRRSVLRTSLTYLAVFVLTVKLVLLYTIITFIGNVTAEKEANFKAIVTHKTLIPSQMPTGYYETFKNLVLHELPPDMRPTNGEKDVMSWSFVFATTDPVNKRPENSLPMFCMEPEKITTMMDGLDDLTGDERRQLDEAVAVMGRNKQAIVVSQGKLKRMNLRVGQRVKMTGLNYPDMQFEYDIIGTLPDGKYEGVGFMNKTYLDQMLKKKVDENSNYAMADKGINLIWVRLPNRAAFERLNAMVDDPKNFNKVPVKMETASSGIGSWLDAYKDIFFGLKFILAPAMVGIMCLVIANAIGISVRERRTEMAVLKVLGFQPRHVMLLVLGEAILVGVLAGGMAAFLCWSAIGNVKMQIAFFGAFFVPGEALVLGPALGTVVAVVGSLGPALRAKNVKVAEVFARVA
jgi:putative ABC transport system permease protein